MQPLENFFKFPTFATQADAKAAGKTVKPFVATDPIKGWIDENAQPSFRVLVGSVQVEYTSYLSGFFGWKGGVADIHEVVIPTELARRFNLPFTGLPGENTAAVAGQDNPVIPVPLNPLTPGSQVLMAHTGVGGGIAQVWAPEDFQSQGTDWTGADRSLLSAIKAGVDAIKAKLQIP